MARRWLPLSLVLTFALGCDSGSGEPKAPAKADPKQSDTKPEPAKPEPEPKPAEPEPDAEPTPEPDAPEPEPAAAKLDPAKLDPGVDPPPSKELERLADELGLRNVAVAAKPVGFGPRTYALALRTREGDPAQFTLEVLLVHLPEGDAPAWSRVPGTRHRLHDWKDEGWSEDPGKIPTSLFVEDYDADGEAEIMVRFRYEEMLGGGGLNTSTDMVILNVADTGIDEAFRANLHHLVTVFETKGKASFEDQNGDGHPDLVIRQRELEEDKQVDSSESWWLWDPSSDRYEPKPK